MWTLDWKSRWRDHVVHFDGGLLNRWVRDCLSLLLSNVLCFEFVSLSSSLLRGRGRRRDNFLPVNHRLPLKEGSNVVALFDIPRFLGPVEFGAETLDHFPVIVGLFAVSSEICGAADCRHIRI